MGCRPVSRTGQCRVCRARIVAGHYFNLLRCLPGMGCMAKARGRVDATMTRRLYVHVTRNVQGI